MFWGSLLVLLPVTLSLMQATLLSVAMGTACLFVGPMTLAQTKTAIDMIHETSRLMEEAHGKKAKLHQASTPRHRPAD